LPLLVVEALAAELRLLGLETSIKPPNDLMVENRKLAGVLTAIQWRGGEIRHVRFGLGLNGRHPIRPPGVTLEQLLGPRCPPWPCLVGLGLRALERLCPETFDPKH
jgi:BirA family biotin operon repressor/biotin-[acetyl-CoA-carboxylase] ligase